MLRRLGGIIIVLRIVGGDCGIPWGSWLALCGWIFDCWTVLSCCMLCGSYCGVMESYYCVAYWVRSVLSCGWTDG